MTDPANINPASVNTDTPLDRIPADRRLINTLYSHNKINRAARDYALTFLYPEKKWGLWISRLLLATGCALILSGILYFFAFNWAKVPPMAKLTSLQLAMLAGLAGAFFYKLNTLPGKLSLLATSVLTGIFMAVFGQIYQTGADAWQLFMAWSALILGWTLLANFAALWLLWLLISNLFVMLWWHQAAMPDRQSEALIFIILSLLNSGALALMEFYAHHYAAPWLHTQWLRIVLLIAVLTDSTIPVLSWIIDLDSPTRSLTISALVGLFSSLVLFVLYRFKIPDIRALAASGLAICIMLDAAAIRLIGKLFGDAEFFMFLLMGLATLAIFTLSVLYLRRCTFVLALNRASEQVHE